MEVKRICIYPKDIQRITGKSERYGRLLLSKVKRTQRKRITPTHNCYEFCRYTELKIEQVALFIAG